MNILVYVLSFSPLRSSSTLYHLVSSFVQARSRFFCLLSVLSLLICLLAAVCYLDSALNSAVTGDAHWHRCTSSLSHRHPHPNILTLVSALGCLHPVPFGFWTPTFRITEGPQILCAETACPTSHTHHCLLQFTYLLLLLASAALPYLHISPAVYQPELVVLGYPYNLGYVEKVAYFLVPKFSILSEKYNFLSVVERRDADTMVSLRYRVSPSPWLYWEAHGSSFVPILSTDQSIQEPFVLSVQPGRIWVTSLKDLLLSVLLQGITGRKAVPGSLSFLKGFLKYPTCG